MVRPPLLVVFALMLTLAACGGGSGGVTPNGGTSTPTPSGSPTPAPGTGTHLSGAATYKGGWTPYGVASGLDFPVQHGWNGAGQGVAIVIDSDVDRSVVQSYVSTLGLQTPAITTVSVDGSSGVTSSGDATEAYLDVETIAGLAPGAHIYIYQIADLSDSSIAKAYSKINSDRLARVVNSSFGGCEASNLPEDPFIASGAQAGIAYVAAAGDTGNVCNPPSTVGASWPASNPNAIGAGGTETRPASGYAVTSDTVWNDTSCSGTPSQCAGGGGVSKIYALPAYQSGLAGVASTTHRNTPDISMPGEDAVIDDGSWALINGTSWSTPEYAALMAQLYQYCHVSGGIANPVNIAYYVASHAPSALIDVTKGNDQYQSTTPFYTAAAGYDDASGLGVPSGMAFANTACPGGNKAPGLLARSAMSTMTEVQTPTSSAPLDVTPREKDVVDRGRRAGVAATPIQVVLRSEADRAPVESALVAAGFTIDRRFTYEGIVQASAPSAAIERAFHTELHDVAQPRAGVRYMPVTQIALPQSLAGHVQTISLDNVVTRHVLTARR